MALVKTTQSVGFNSAVHFVEPKIFQVESTGMIQVDDFGALAMPLIGTSSGYAAGSGTTEATTLSNYGVSHFLVNGTSSRRNVILTAPIAGVIKYLICTSDAASSSGGIAFDAGASVTFDGTSRYLVNGSSVSGAVATSVTLVGVSATAWRPVAMYPSSTAWALGAAT